MATRLLGILIVIAIIQPLLLPRAAQAAWQQHQSNAALGIEVPRPATTTTPVGSVNGTFAVSPSGSATYSIPITVPPGTNGLQPSLALAYSSQIGNGLLGVGWALSGLSVIHRCAATIELDGARGSVRYDANDRLCLDGERLLPISGRLYTTRQESLLRINAVGGAVNAPDYFTITDKDGTLREYGSVPTARIEAAGTSAVRLWALNKQRDRYGNYYTISYSEDTANGDYRPSQIDYTGNVNNGRSPTNSIRFSYTARPDVAARYEGGSAQRVTQRLAGIESYTGSLLVRSYRLSYDTLGMGVSSRLTAIQECGSDGVCLPSTTLGWRTATSPAFRLTTNPITPANIKDGTALYPGDWNGDGIGDLLWYDRASGNNRWYTNRGAASFSEARNPIAAGAINNGDGLYPGDWNGDGIMDVLWYNRSDGNNRWYINNGTGGLREVSNPIAAGSINNGNGVYPGDWNGDGLSDLLWHNSGDGNNRWYTNRGAASFSEVRNPIDPKAINEGMVLYPGDWNGDGVTDVLAYDSADGTNRWFTRQRDGSLTTASDPIRASAINGGTGIFLGDWNGDGIMDLLWYDSASGNNRWYINNGNGAFFETNNPISATDLKGATKLYQSDWNGDGITDLLWYNRTTGSNRWYIGNGQLAFQRVADPISPTALKGGTALYLGDWNGDSLTDLLWYDRASGANHWYASSQPRANLLSAITNGFKATISISYKPLTDAGVYVKEGVPAYPVQQIQAPIYVVAQTSESNGNGGQLSTAYLYGGLKADLRANESLGFRWVRVTDAAGLLHYTYHNQDRARGLDGTVDKTVTVAANVRIRSTTNTWTLASAVCGGRSQPQLTTSVEQTRDPNDTVIAETTTSTSYDACGFPLTVRVASNDGWRRTVTNRYAHNTSSWRLGQLTRVEALAEAPGVASQTRVTEYRYINDLLDSEVIEPQQPALTLTTSYQYDPFGNRVGRSVSGAGVPPRSETIVYDPSGRFVIRHVNALGYATTTEYDPRSGQPTRQQDPNGLLHQWQYDGFGRTIREIRPDATSSAVTYSAAGNGFKTTIESTGVAPVVTSFDQLGRTVRSATRGLGGAWIFQDTTYDALGRVASRSVPYTEGTTAPLTTMAYDALGRVTAVTDPGGRLTSTTYNGLSTTVSNPLGQVTSELKNSQGKPVELRDAAGTTRYQYDPFGNPVRITDALGNLSILNYDVRGRKIGMRDPDMGTWNYAYDALGALTRQIDAKGQQFTMRYDLLGRLISRTTPEGTSTWRYDTAPGGIGKLAELTQTDGYREVYSYDQLSRPVKVTTTVAGQSFAVSTGYDAVGRITTLAYPASGYTVQHGYDTYGNLTQLLRLQAGSSPALLWRASAADARGQVTQETFGNGVASQRTYDPTTGALSGVQTSSGSSVIQKLAFNYDVNGNLIARNDTVAKLSETFVYDQLNRLIRASGATAKSYQYDALGNIVSKSDVGTYLYNPSGPNSVRPHAVIGTRGTYTTNYQYDANGNMTSGGGRTISYTSFNKPSAITMRQQTTRLSYDPRGNRVQKITPSGTTTTIGKLYEYHKSGSGGEHRMYVYAGSSLVAIHTARSNGTSSTRYIHTAQLDSVDVVTDERGAVVERLSYDPHGLRRQVDGRDTATPPTSSVNRGFTRHVHDDEVGLIDMQARLYDPLLGRFISADSMVEAPGGQGLNRYTYAQNNPLSLSDPSGHFSLRKLFKTVIKVVVTIANLIISTQFPAASGLFTALLVKAEGGSWKDALRAGVRSFITNYFQGYLGNRIDSLFPSWANTVTVPLEQRVVTQLARTGANALTKGIIAEINGGSFGAAMRSSVLADTVRWGLESYAVDEYRRGCTTRCGLTWKPGKGGPDAKDGDDVSVLNARHNNIGVAWSSEELNACGCANASWGDGAFWSKWGNEGMLVSRVANAIPGMNGMSIFHDRFAMQLKIVNEPLYTVFNVGSIAPAIVVNYVGLDLNNVLYQQRLLQRRAGP